jgi:hypothetical protein
VLGPAGGIIAARDPLAIRSRFSARLVRSQPHRGRCVVLAGVVAMVGWRDGEMTMVLEEAKDVGTAVDCHGPLVLP